MSRLTDEECVVVERELSRILLRMKPLVKGPPWLGLYEMGWDKAASTAIQMMENEINEHKERLTGTDCQNGN